MPTKKIEPSESSEPTVVTVRAEPIELCQLLKFAGLSDSGGEAKQVISEGKVRLNGIVEMQKRKKVRAGDRVEYGAETLVVAVGASG
jgi:ribosome-associated protein